MNEVTLWLSDTRSDLSPRTRSAQFAVLSPAEKRAAERFIHKSHSDTYVQAHCLKRKVLAATLGRSSESLRFGRGTHGRPYLLGQCPMSFNLSHTRGLVAFGLHNQSIGVDVECLRDNVDMKTLSRRVLSQAETHSLNLEAPASQTRFFDYWTIKEAYSKARGLGITMPFRVLDFAIDSNGFFDPKLDQVNDSPDRWHFGVYDLDGVFRIAVAAKTNDDLKVKLTFVDPLTLSAYNTVITPIADQKTYI